MECLCENEHNRQPFEVESGYKFVVVNVVVSSQFVVVILHIACLVRVSVVVAH